MRLTIRTKLLAGFGIILLLLLVVGTYSLVQVRTLSTMLSAMYSREVVGISIIKEAKFSLASRGLDEKNAILASDPTEIEKQVAAAEGAADKMLACLDQYEPLIATERGRAIFRQVRQLWRDFKPIEESVFREARANNDRAAIANAERGRLLINQIQDLMAEISGLKEGVAKRNSESAEASAAVAFWIVLAILLIAVVLGLAIGLISAQQISRGVTMVAQAADGIAQGELDHQVEVKSRDELGDMAQSFQRMIAYLREMAGAADEVARGNLTVAVSPRSEQDTLGKALGHMVTNLQQIVYQVRTASESVGAGAQQIASSSTELAKTVAVQASSAEETSAAMEEMAANIQSVDKNAQDLGAKVTMVRSQSDELAAAVTQTSSSISELAASVQQVAGNVAHANRMADQASEAANAGEQAVTQTTAGMNAIAETMEGIRSTIQVLEERSSEIGAIIEVIDDIAEQTNLLALNAAIEAARAGEAGRGFAVVADEVRKLAERSAKATGEIGALIKGIQKETAQAVGVTQDGATKVQEGVQLAANTGEALSRIKAAAHQVTSLLSEVAAATSEQARASQQIVAASEQMAGVNHKVTGAVSEMDQITRSVTYATGEQRQGTDQVVIAVESLSKSSQEASTATDQVSAAADSLSEQARLLQEAVSFFHLADQPAARQIELKVGRPLALPSKI